MRVTVIINEMAGSVIGRNRAEFEREVLGPFEASGARAELTFVHPDSLDQYLEHFDPASADVFVIGGGDGTVRSFAAAMLDAPSALGILPVGTMNRLARDLSIPLDIPAAAVALAKASPFSMDVAEVNGSIFLCNSLIGLPPRYSEMRQRVRGKALLERIQAGLAMLSTLVATRRRLALTIDDGQIARTVRALSLAVSNNAYGETASALLTRPRLDEGTLALYLSQHRRGFALIPLLLRAALGWWAHDDPQFEVIRAKCLRIESKARSIKLSNDGEVERMKTPLVYTIRPRALRVLAPCHPTAPPVADPGGAP